MTESLNMAGYTKRRKKGLETETESIDQAENIYITGFFSLVRTLEPKLCNQLSTNVHQKSIKVHDEQYYAKKKFKLCVCVCEREYSWGGGERETNGSHYKNPNTRSTLLLLCTMRSTFIFQQLISLMCYI